MSVLRASGGLPQPKVSSPNGKFVSVFFGNWKAASAFFKRETCFKDKGKACERQKSGFGGGGGRP